MTIPLKLEEFGTLEKSGRRGAVSGTTDVEGLKLEAYEAGYKSGWEDANSSEASSRSRISADLTQNLHDISFTFLEARAAVLTSLQPLLREIVDCLLPRLVAEGLAEVVDAELLPIAQTMAEPSCVLICAPVARSALERLIERHMETSISIVEEPAYADGQVTLRYGSEEREINLSASIEKIATAIRDFTSQMQSEGVLESA
jgi:hypothetical protein